MNERKYTPGPWHVSDNDGAHCMVRGRPVPQMNNGETTQMNNGETIAQVWLQDTDFNDHNAHLIAAAPEMLEALKQLRDAMVRYLSGSETKLYEVTLATAAIDKAEGRRNE